MEPKIPARNMYIFSDMFIEYRWKNYPVSDIRNFLCHGNQIAEEKIASGVGASPHPPTDRA